MAMKLSYLALVLFGLFFIDVVSYSQAVKLTPPPKGKYKFDGKIETTYDGTKDETMVFFKPIRIESAEWPSWEGTTVVNTEGLAISMYFTYTGQRLVTPSWIGIGFLSSTTNPEEYTDYVLSFLVDGKAIALGAVNVLKKGGIRTPQGLIVREIFESRIPYEQFLILANAKKSKFRIGAKEFNLDKQQLEAIRDLASRSSP
jgi:hypothetical protein